MLKIFKNFGIIVFITTMGFSLITCDEIFESTGVTISGTPKVDETLTATSHGDFKGYFFLQVQHSDLSWNSIESFTNGTNREFYTVRYGTEGRNVRAFRYHNKKGQINSNVLGPIQTAE